MRPTSDDHVNAPQPLLAPAWQAFISIDGSPSRSNVIDFVLAASRFRAVQKRPRSPFEVTTTPIEAMAITQVSVQTDGSWVPINLDGLPAKLNGRRLRPCESQMLWKFGGSIGATTPQKTSDAQYTDIHRRTSSEIDTKIDEFRPPSAKPSLPTRLVFTDDQIRRIDLLS